MQNWFTCRFGDVFDSHEKETHFGEFKIVQKKHRLFSVKVQ